MICSSVNLFFTSNLLFLGLDSKLRCYSNQGGRRPELTPEQHFAKDLALDEAIRARFGVTL